MPDSNNVYCFADNRLFYLSDNIGESTISKINANLLLLIQKDDNRENKEKDFKREPIKLYIDSYGGDIRSMWSLVSIIENSKTPIYTYCQGYAMSSGFLIFIAGHKRFISKRATLLYHQVSCMRSGKYQDLKEDRNDMDFIQSEIERFVVDKTKITQEKINEVREKKIDWYIYPDIAIDLGCADEII